MKSDQEQDGDALKSRPQSAISFSRSNQRIYLLQNSLSLLKTPRVNCICLAPYSIITEEAIDLLADRLLTPLQIEHHLTLAFEAAYMSGESPVTETVVESVLAKDIDGLEQKLTRHGYNVKTLATTVNVQPKVIRSFLRGKLSPGQSQEIQEEMLAAGIPL